MNSEDCQKVCSNEFVSCMQMALDSFAMGACYDAEKSCEKQCKLAKQESHPTGCMLKNCIKKCENCNDI